MNVGYRLVFERTLNLCNFIYSFTQTPTVSQEMTIYYKADLFVV